MSKIKTKEEDNTQFAFAASLIQILSFAIALFMIVISKYAFIFFSAAMLPTIIAVFFDRKNHRCASATICTFNLVGAMPYLIKLWESSSINLMAKTVIADFDTWLIIYVTAFVGQLIYILLPLLVVKIYVAKAAMRASVLEMKKEKICLEWDIESEEHTDEAKKEAVEEVVA